MLSEKVGDDAWFYGDRWRKAVGEHIVEDRLAKLTSHQATIEARRDIEGGDEKFATKHICFGYHAKLTTNMPSIDRLEWRLIVGRELGEVHNLSTIYKFPPV